MSTTYIAKAAFWEIFETDFDEGDGDYIQSFSTDLDIECSDLETLIETVVEEMSLDKKDMFVDADNSSLGFSVLVDVENTEASKQDVDLWKQGELELYHADIVVPVTKIVDESEVPSDEMEKAAQKAGVAVL